MVFIGVSSMQKIERQTLLGIRDQLASYGWEDAEIDELVDPQLGIITGFQDLLDQLEQLRKVDLKATPPAGDITKP
jgi:hypothetical protein